MNIKLASAVLFCSIAMSCSVSHGQLLDRVLSRIGCSGCGAATACDTGCDTGCGGEVVTSGCGNVDPCGCGPRFNVLNRIKDRLARVGCGCEKAEPCGCEEPVVESCGCEEAPSCRTGILDRLKSRLSSIGGGCGCLSAPNDCGCNVAPVALESPCGCDAAPSCGGGLLDRLRGRFSSIGSGSCGCSEPVAAPACGCDSAPAVDCGCNRTPVRNVVGGVVGRLQNVGGQSVCGCGSNRLNLLDRLRGSRAYSDPCGGVVDNGCNDSCGGCGSGATVIQGTTVAPMTGGVIGGGVVTEPAPAVVEPAPTQPATPSVIEEAPVDETPEVDPNAFINRGRNISG